MKELLEPLIPLILITAGVCWTAVWVFLNAEVRPTVKALLIPGALIGALLVPALTFLLLGYSVKLPLPAEIIVFSHKTLIVENKKTRIEIWGIAPKAKATRLYSIPYTKQLEKQLEAAEAGRNEGRESVLKRRGSGDGDGNVDGQGQEAGDGPDTEWSLTLRQPSNLPPKEGSTVTGPLIPDVMR